MKKSFVKLPAAGISVGGGSGVSVGGTGVSVGGTGVFVGWTGVSVGGSDVSVGGMGVSVGGTGVLVGVDEGVLLGVDVRVGIGVLLGVRVGVLVNVGVADGSKGLVLVGRRGRRVEVALAVTEGEAEGDRERVNVMKGLAVALDLMVFVGAVGVIIAVKKSLANSARVNARSVLTVAVGEVLPVFGMIRLGSCSSCLDAPVI